MRCTGYPAFFDDDENEAVITRKILAADYDFNPSFWGHISQEAKDLVSGLLTVDFNRRLTCEAALNSAWIHVDDHLLELNSLKENQAQYKAFRAKRRLKSSVKAVMMIGRMRRLSSLRKINSTENVNDAPPGGSASTGEGVIDGNSTSAMVQNAVETAMSNVGMNKSSEVCAAAIVN
jgi:serine/threonine protein kinase